MHRPFLLVPLALLLLLTAGTAAASPTVLFDQGHGQRFLIDQPGPLQLSELAQRFGDGGWRIGTTDQPLSDAVLADAEALVCSGPFRPFAPEEVEAIVRFLERGGRMAVMLHIAPPAAPLLHRLGIAFSNGVIREQNRIIGDNPLDFTVNRLLPHPLTEGLEQFSLYGSWALTGTTDDVTVIASSGDRSWVDLNGNGRFDSGDASQPFGVLVTGSRGEGQFAVFGDDAIFQNRFLTGASLSLADNLIDWLARRSPAR